MESIVNQLMKEKLLPLYTVNDLALLDKVEDTLLKHNLSFIEVTYRSELASEAINYLAQSGKLIVGAGTVRTIDTAKEAIENGAKFIVTPGLDAEIVKYCNEQNVPVVPGAVTPTEIMQAQSLGVNVVKFFPANVYGGLDAIKSLSGPFYDVKFVPTGGVNKANYVEFLSNEAIAAVGGSFIISEKMFKDDQNDVDKHLEELVKNIAQ